MDVSILDNLCLVPTTTRPSYVLRFALLEREIIFLLHNASYDEALQFLETFVRKTGWLAVSKPIPRVLYNGHVRDLRNALNGDNRI